MATPSLALYKPPLNLVLGGSLNSNLVETAWLKRTISLPNTPLLTYSGRGLGTEKCSINGEEFIATAEFDWFVPEFDFDYGAHHLNVQVRVWPWFTIRSIEVRLDNTVVYAEGREPYRVSRLTEMANIFATGVIFLGPLFILSKLL